MLIAESYPAWCVCVRARVWYFDVGIMVYLIFCVVQLQYRNFCDLFATHKIDTKKVASVDAVSELLSWRLCPASGFRSPSFPVG